ncbi:MAG: hypothetical protein ACRBBP_07995, partial [Bdellovibrionales bacterium]
PRRPHQMGNSLINSHLPSMFNSPINQAIERWVEAINRKCPDCVVKGRRVTLPNGFWFEITTDLWALEVKTKPVSLEEFKNLQEPLQNLVWSAANQADVRPHDRLGGGHIHLDIESHFGKDRLAFRNFIVDLANRPELFMGAFGFNYFNAPPLALFGQEALDGFKEVLHNFDTHPDLEIKDLMHEINHFYSTLKNPVVGGTSEKFHAVNLTHFDLGALGTVELRGFRPQLNALHTELLMEIFTGRIRELKKRRTPLLLNAPDYSKHFDSVKTSNGRVYKNTIPAKQILRTLVNFLKDSRITLNAYDPFITEELKDSLNTKSEALASLSCRSLL